MKQLFLIIGMLSLGIAGAYAQSGIYQSAEDFENGKLIYQQEEGEKHAIRTEIPLNQCIIKVKKGDESVKLIKVDLYGYRNKKNQDFRFYDDIRYKIVDPSHFYIYSREVNVIRGKARTRETKYFFSKDAESPVMELTRNNLKHAFPGNRDFHYLIDMQFRNDRELVAYDSYYKQYKLKGLFNRSLM